MRPPRLSQAKRLIRDEFAEGYSPVSYNSNHVYKDSTVLPENRRAQCLEPDETTTIVFRTLNKPFLWN